MLHTWQNCEIDGGIWKGRDTWSNHWWEDEKKTGLKLQVVKM